MLNENPSIELKDFVYDSIKAYTKEVVEDRAVPEFKDGLKPVQRKILWAMYKIGLFHNLAYKKSAKVAGDVMGKYHPHGDCYPAIVNLSQANKKYYLVDGQGNWGNYDSPAASSRYTECKLSKFAETVLLDKDYLKVIPYIDNYDGTEKEPLYLPARLPTILLLGASGIAVGTKVNIPVFELNSVIDCLIDYIKTDNLNTDNLRLAHLYKGLDITNKESFNEYLKTGSGQLIFMPRIEEIKRDGKTALIITGLPDNFNYSNMLEKLNNMQEVKSCTDEGAGDIKIVIQLKTNLIEDKERVLKALETKYHANTDILNRLIKDKEAINANHSEANIISILKNWVKFRIYLERKYLTNLIEEKDKEIEYQKLLLKAAESLPIIFEALKQDDTEKILMEKMQIFKEQADIILNLPVKRLSKLDKEKTTEILNEKLLKKEELICKIKNIKNTVMQDLTYLKEMFKGL